MDNKEDKFHISLRTTNQRVSRRDYINQLPESIRTEFNNFDYFVSPEREILVMDLLEKFNTRTILTKEYETKAEVYRFIKAFKRIPNNLDVYVWSSGEYGPVYKIDLKWVIEKIQFILNSQNNFDLVIISDNGKIGLMITKHIEYNEETLTEGEITYVVKKWGLM